MEVIRFKCPSCTAALKFRPSAAGRRGRCPKCSAEIIGPDPDQDQPARLAESSPPEDRNPAPFAEPPVPVPPTSSSPPERPEKETPEPSPSATAHSAEPDPPSTEKNSGTPAAGLVLACLLCSILAFVLGFSLGRKQPETESPVPSSASAMPESEEADRLPVPIQVRTWIPDHGSEESATPSTAGPEATLRAFLAAEDWKSRNVHVRSPEILRERMEKRAADRGEGAIETTAVTLLHITPQAHIFRVATPTIPKGFPVAVARSNDGWKVDWETFTEFHDDRFQRFASGEDGPSGAFHLMVNPVETESPKDGFARYRLTPPMPNREQLAYVPIGSTAHSRLSKILSEQDGLADDDFRKLLEGSGPPMVLALSYRKNSQGQAYLRIDDVVAVGWGPVEP